MEHITPEGWTVIIGAVFLGIGQILTIVLNWLGQRRNFIQGRTTAENVAEVHRTIAQQVGSQEGTNGAVRSNQEGSVS